MDKPLIIDTHCHLDFPQFDADRQQLIDACFASGMGCLINIGSSLEGSRRSLELAGQYARIYATVGIHPHEADSADSAVLDSLRGLFKAPGHEKIVAIGETGLDFFRNFSQVHNQERIFSCQLDMAEEFSLPVVIHTREAFARTMEILKQYPGIKAVIHCFSGSMQFLDECLAAGFMLSFTCNVTFEKSHRLKGFIAHIPLERMMLETDSPYIPPEGKRGQRNDPRNVEVLAEEVARIKGISRDEVVRATTENAVKFFALKI